MENRLSELSSIVPRVFVEALATGAATPGGGSAAAAAGAMGAALVHMVAELTIGHRQDTGRAAEMREIRRQAADLQVRLLHLAEEDAIVFNQVMAAYGLPKKTEKERQARKSSVQRALREAIRVPLETARAGVETLRLALQVVERLSLSARSDAITGGHLAYAAVQSAAQNVTVNAGSLQDAAGTEDSRSQIAELRGEADRLLRSIIRGDLK